MKIPHFCGLVATVLLPLIALAQAAAPVRVTTPDGILEGDAVADGAVHAFKGVPYAAPPVGPLRWRPPQPVTPWSGVREAHYFGPRAMQARIYDDMIFRDFGPSEDCLYLNVWTPARAKAGDKLAVMVWIHGGGFTAGASSEPRQDGTNLAKKDVIIVSINYRMGIFGFFSHPELTAESPQHASGNYGLLDAVAALQWVKRNIAAFGGDPDNVTIFGESAGSSAVSALMASPLAQGLFHRAIGESGTILNPRRPMRTLAEAEAAGSKDVQERFGTTSLAKLRELPAAVLLAGSMKEPQLGARVVVDGWFLPSDGLAIFSAGKQARVPLLAGWNRDEDGAGTLLEKDAPTLTNFQGRARARYGERAGDFLKAYAPATDAEVKRMAQDFGTDLRIGYPTWNWLELQRKVGVPVWRYRFDQTLPRIRPDAKPDAELVAPHASEIEYVFQNLDSRQADWGPEHRAVSAAMADYWTNFAKTGNPAGAGTAAWPEYGEGDPLMVFAAKSAAAPDPHRARYEFLDSVARQR